MGRRFFRSYYKGHMDKIKGEGGGGEGIVGRGDYRIYYKGHMDKIKGRVELQEGGGFGWGGSEEKMQTTVIEQQ